MDYSELNIYNKNKFILRSETRQRKFPFIKFDGSNYEEVKAFLSLYAPNIIIEPQALKIGELYSISGKDYSLLRIPYDELRFVIASNPYLVSEEGVISLALDSEQAEEYLKENRHHKLFAFENPLATYKFIPEHSAFMMYDYSHPLGLAFNDLHKEYEWYICGDDGANRKWYGQKIEINTVNHTIALRPDFGGLVYRIVHIITAINKNLAIQGRPAMFVYSWDIEEWKKNLKKKCLNEEHFRAFVDTMYSIVFNQNSGDRTSPLEDIDDAPFAKIIDGLHYYYVYGRESKKAPVTHIFSNYLNHNQGPQETYDYTKLKEGILVDFYDYLIRILESVKNDLTIVGNICEDENGYLYCGKALLSQDFYMYRGCKCEITFLINNPDEKTVGKYPYYSDKLNSVTLNRTGIISQDEEGTFYIDKYILKGAVANQLGKAVQLGRIHPFDKPKGQYLGVVIDCVLSDAGDKAPTGVGQLGHKSKKERGGKKLKPMTFPMSSRPGPEPKHWLVEKYAKIPDIDVKVSKKLKKNVWDKLIKEVRLLNYPQQLKESSRDILCASLIFHAAEESGIAFVEIIPNEKKGVDYVSDNSYEDYFDMEGNNTEDGGNNTSGGIDEKKQREAALTKQGFSIINTAEEAGLSEKEVGKKYAKHFPLSYTKTLNLMGVSISRGGPENYLRMLNYWLPKYTEWLEKQDAAKGRKDEFIQVAGDIALFLDDCKTEIKSVKVLMTKNQKQLTDILNKLENELPPYFDSIK